MEVSKKCGGTDQVIDNALCKTLIKSFLLLLLTVSICTKHPLCLFLLMFDLLCGYVMSNKVTNLCCGMLQTKPCDDML